jgi:branched-chain amino acid transport system permease protein
MLVLGGSGRLFGALLGAATLLLIEHELSAINPFHWMTMVGVMLIVVVLYLPQGLSGVLDVITSRYRRSA